jgi:hypothetical protein
MRLKMWDDPDWSRRITPRLHVGMVDEELPESERGKKWKRKSWYITLTQNPDLLKKIGQVKGLPKTGTTLLLFEDDVIALVDHVCQCGLVESDGGRVRNGDDHE